MREKIEAQLSEIQQGGHMNLRIVFAILLLVVWCASGSACLADGARANKQDGGSESPFPAGSITCYTAGGSWTGAAHEVQIGSGGGLRYVWPESGLEILTTEQCVANAGPVALTVAPRRSSIECLTVAGEIVVVAVASQATTASGVAVWRDEETADVYLSTLACRVRRLE